MNLYVGNLSPETTEQHLSEIFSEFGKINSVKIIIDSATGLPKGFGFVEMDEKFSAYDAIDNLDATYFMGNIISVKEAKGNKTNNRGGGSKPFQKRQGGFNSNRGGGGGAYNQNRSSGGYNSNRSSGGGYQNRSGSGGSYNRDRNTGGGYNPNSNSEGASGYNPNSIKDNPGNDDLSYNQ